MLYIFYYMITRQEKIPFHEKICFAGKKQGFPDLKREVDARRSGLHLLAKVYHGSLVEHQRCRV